MNNTIFQIDVDIHHKTDAERDEKIWVVTELLTEIMKSKEGTNDMKRINRFLAIIKGRKQTKLFYIMQVLLSFIIICLLLVISFWISIKNWDLMVSSYVWWNIAYGYYIKETNNGSWLWYGKIEIDGCSETACTTDRWIVLKRYIDYYSVF